MENGKPTPAGRDQFIYAKLHLTIEDAPVQGIALYLVIGGEPKVTKYLELLHVPTLTVFKVPANVFDAACKDYEHYDTADAVKRIEAKLENFAKLSLQHPAQRIRKAIAQMTGKPIEDVVQFKTPSPAAGTKAKGAGGTQGPGIIDSIYECLKGDGKTKEEILARLKERFPARPEGGMKTTINCQLRRLPAAKGFTLVKATVEGRGEVLRAEENKQS